MKLFKVLKLWYFWNMKLKKDEFSSHLSNFGVYKEGYTNLRVLQEVVISRRELAHQLDMDDSLENMKKLVQTSFYKKAKL